MPSINGHVRSPSPQDSSINVKRKRADEVDVDGTTSEQIGTDWQKPGKDARRVLKDLMEILKSNDTSPSILTCSLDDNADMTNGHLVKKPKLSSSNTPKTISTKFENCAYTSIDELVADINHASDKLLESAPNSSLAPVNSQHEFVQPLVDQEQLSMKVVAFKRLIGNIAVREKRRWSEEPRTNGHLSENDERPQVPESSNEDEEAPKANDEEADAGQNVLTLFGTAGGHKQLFSSMQKLHSISTHQEHSRSETPSIDTSVRLPKPLNEYTLPQGISLTKLLPTNVDDAISWRRQPPRLIDVFPPPAFLPPHNPPKTPQNSTTASIITWTQNDTALEVARTPGQGTETLTTGHWLGYGGMSPAQVPTSPEAKRKQRDRALSTGETRPRLSDGLLAAQLQAKEDALFRCAYSSFAPSRDDAAAVVPELLRSQVWWQKVGKPRFEEMALDPVLVDATSTGSLEPMDILEDNDESGLKEAVENFKPDDVGHSPWPVETEGPEDPNGILSKISDMLETLNSYQRARLSILSSNSRSAFGQNNSLQDLMGSPSTPSPAEVGTYLSLRSELLRTILDLPPFVVAKLDGEQLSDLSISKKIVIEGKDYRGVMEDDQLSRITKQAALSAAAGAGTMVRPASSQLGGMGSLPSHGQYSSRTPSIPQSSRQQMYHTPQTFSRPPPNYSRQQPLTSWQTPQAPRPQGQYAPQAYSQQTPRPFQPQSAYRQSSNTFSPRPGSGQPLENAYQQSNHHQFQPMPQQRTHQAPTAQMYTKPQPTPDGSQGPQGSASPQAPRLNTSASYGSPQPNHSQQQTSQSPQKPTPTQPQLGPSGFHTSMTTEQQQTMMDRQRAQLAQQQAVQQTIARGAAQAGMSHANGQSSASPVLEDKETPEQQVNGMSS